MGLNYCHFGRGPDTLCTIFLCAIKHVKIAGDADVYGIRVPHLEIESPPRRGKP